MYKVCLLCSYISKVEKDQSFECEKCSNRDDACTSPFPKPAAQNFLNHPYSMLYDLEDVDNWIELFHFNGFETSGLFLCSAYEVLLESMINDVLKAMNTNEKVSELLLNSNQGQERMGRLLASLLEVGNSMKTVCKRIEQEEFYGKMQKIIKVRNSYIHGDHKAFRDSEVEAEDLKYVCDSIIDVFVTLNNQYVYSGT
ncbi:hypothetical protein PVOR_25243 [Paenibacillus vortex V453]|uniref:Uncharacterized protein n=1 Tax=Paenibacillus vortex V453 TaxID=715225 RepID=A0A2R9SPQ7_9BACL|nr:hypothetical protein [Paenibacillus vortex]EFU39326.1 hypothetical protein PVOR_25243 [Paenibacillus vortex V453]